MSNFHGCLFSFSCSGGKFDPKLPELLSHGSIWSFTGPAANSGVGDWISSETARGGVCSPRPSHAGPRAPAQRTRQAGDRVRAVYRPTRSAERQPESSGARTPHTGEQVSPFPTQSVLQKCNHLPSNSTSDMMALGRHAKRETSIVHVIFCIPPNIFKKNCHDQLELQK